MAVFRFLSRRDPLILFLLIGGAFFAIYWAVNLRGQRIDVPMSVQNSLAEDYELMMGRKPDAAARRKLIDDYVTDELLFREAIDRGMHMTDLTTKQRLIDRVRFMVAGAPPEPKEEELINYYAEHTQTYRSEPRMSVEHVFFAEKPADPGAVLARLRGGEKVAGDDFWMGKQLPDYGESMLRGMFGQDFLVTARAAKPNEWFGPVRSSRGWHFVRVTGTAPASMMPYPEVRDQVRQDYQASIVNKAVADEVARIGEKYDVEIEK